MGPIRCPQPVFSVSWYIPKLHKKKREVSNQSKNPRDSYAILTATPRLSFLPLSIRELNNLLRINNKILHMVYAQQQGSINHFNEEEENCEVADQRK